MTRAKTSWLASLVLGFTFGGTAAAQSPQQPAQNPDDKQQPANPNDNTTAPTQEGTKTDAQNNTTPMDTQNTRPVYVDAPTTIVATNNYDRPERIGFAISAGGGASGFTNEALRGATDPGGDWDVRVTFGTRSPLAIEASYIGSAQAISALGVDSDALLVGNGVQGALRLNATLDSPVQPFIFAGLAWRRYDLTNTNTNTSDLSDVDNVAEVPVGVGIAGKFSGLILDARGEFRPTLDSDLLPELTATGATGDFEAMHRWGVNASVGYEF
ncbi:MAG TPA: hypothetical protein VIV40_12985 [Kofleriaceae bacterium]